MSELAADGIPVALTFRVVKLARRPYCRWLAKVVPESDLVQAYRANGWSVRFGKKPKRGKGSKSGSPVYDDRVQRDFTAAANQL